MRVETFYDINYYISKLNIHSLNALAWHTSKQLLNRFLPRYYRNQKRVEGKSAREYTDSEVIISMTTFPGRINTVPLVLDTIISQTVKADRIILWVAEEQFPHKDVELSLAEYIERGIEIKYCDDIKSHKKYYYSMMENPEAVVITCDDDILYSEFWVERLLSTAKQYPNMIVCERAHGICFKDGHLDKYKNWNYRARNEKGPSLLLCPTGGAGALYPPHSLSPHVFDKEVFKNICLYADDIWLKCMGYMKKTPVVLTRVNAPEIIDTFETNKSGLAKINIGQDLNDKQLADVSNYYSIDWHEE